MIKYGVRRRARTADLLGVNQTLYQLSYTDILRPETWAYLVLIFMNLHWSIICLMASWMVFNNHRIIIEGLVLYNMCYCCLGGLFDVLGPLNTSGGFRPASDKGKNHYSHQNKRNELLHYFHPFFL